MILRSALTLIMLLFAACQTTAPDMRIDYQASLHDSLFPDYRDVVIETEQEIFALSPEMIAFVDKHVLRREDLNARVRSLATSIFERSFISISYQNNANTIASETFSNGYANCLSLTIMTYALADYANLGVRFQQVDVPELWVLAGITPMLNRHINLKLYEKRFEINAWNLNRNYTVDFNQQNRGRAYPSKDITKQRVLSMFYNNKGVDALLDNDLVTAYAYFKKAHQSDPMLVDTYNNLGVLYRRMGHNDLAENNYQLALKIAPNDYTALDNLAILYKMTGRETLGEQIDQQLDIKRRSNPYYHYLLGQQALLKGQILEAKSAFRRAISLKPGNHEFYFAMAQSLYILGDKDASRRYLSLAKRYSDNEEDESRYQYKLRALSELAEVR